MPEQPRGRGDGAGHLLPLWPALICQCMCGISSGKGILYILPQTSDLCFVSASINAGYVLEWILIILIMNMPVGICWVKSGCNCRGLSRQKCFCSCLYHLCPLTSVIWRIYRRANCSCSLAKCAMMRFPFCNQRCSPVVQAIKIALS